MLIHKVPMNDRVAWMMFTTALDAADFPGGEARELHAFFSLRAARNLVTYQ